MATNNFRKCNMYRKRVVLKTTRNLNSVECGTEHLTPKTTILYQTLSPSISWLHFQSKGHWNNLVGILFQRHMLTEETSSIFFWNTPTQTTWYPNLDHIIFLHHCENLKLKASKYKWQKCGRFMLGKLNYMYHTVFNNTVHNALLLCTTFGLPFLLLLPTK